MRLRANGAERDVERPAAMPEGAVAVRDGGAVWVAYRGETYRVEKVIAARSRGGDGDHGLAAPMPGKVLAIHASEGDAVAKGTPLLVLEAMKMEHEIRAPKDGKVRSLKLRAGEMVALGDLLAEVE